MNLYLVAGVVLTAVAVVGCWFLYRCYKRIARRCPKKGCGRSRVKRVHYIYLHQEDKRFPIVSASGAPRWFIRRVVKLTLAECECGWTRLVKVDWEPISLWHAWWTCLWNREQYNQPKTEHALVIYGGLRKLYHGKGALELDPQETDTPPVPDILDELLADLEELVKDAPGSSSINR